MSAAPSTPPGPDAEPITVARADLSDPADAGALVTLLDLYAQDVMGRGAPLPEEVRRRLPQALASNPTAAVFLARVGPEAVGVATTLVGVSTFAARPLVNIHDLAVHPAWRGRGVGARLLAAVERYARERGCVKLTLEVRRDNPARRLYERQGFGPGDPPSDFWTRPLDD